MKRKHIILILLFVLAVNFLVACNHEDFFKMEEKKTSIDNEIKTEDENLEIAEPEIPSPKTTSASILAAGDIMFHMPQNKAAFNPNTGSYDYSDNFKYVKKYTESVDLAMANFETVVAGEGKSYSGFPNFNSPAETLMAIKDAGFHILSTANNHCLDQGKTGLINTIDAIENAGMKNIGTYKLPNTPIMIKEVNEIKIALLSYTYGFNGMDFTLTEEERQYMVNKIQEDKIKSDIEKAKELDVDTVIVFIHWGEEYVKEPTEAQIDLGRKMVEWGANIVFGSHPHVIQKSEIIHHNGQDNYIIYSMGNFLSNQRREILNNKFTEDGIMVKVNLEKDFSEDKTLITNIEHIPTWVRRYKSGNKLKYEILPVEEFIGNEELFNALGEEEKTRVKEAFKDTMDLMIEY